MIPSTLRWLAPAAFALALLGSACGSNEARSDDGPNADSGTADAAAGDAGVSDSGEQLDATILDDTGSDDGGIGPDSESDGGGADAGPGPDVPTGPVEGGGDCQSDADCPFGLFCDLSFGGFCAPAPGPTGSNCSTDADCDFVDSEDVFCCSPAFGTSRCVRAGDPEEGATCGDNTGEQGESCAEGGQSDCEGTSHYCVFDTTDYAYCSQFCTPGGSDCPAGSYCYETGGGQGLCLEFGDVGSEESCADDPTSCDEGYFCVQGVENDPYAYCGLQCSSNAECRTDESCNAFGVCETNGDIEYGESCVEDRFGCAEDLFCLNFGTRAAICTQLCTSDRQCGRDNSCRIFNEETGEGYCYPDGRLGTGESCADDLFACRGTCSGDFTSYDDTAICVDECERDSDCPTGTYCRDFEESGQFCQPDGDGTQGDSCVESRLDCARDHFCIDAGLESAFCAASCTDDSDCGADTWCSSRDGAEGVCLPTGDVEGGDSCEDDRWSCVEDAICGGIDDRCFTSCADDPESCAAGEICLEADTAGNRWCYPTGDLESGDDCSGDFYGCGEDLYCDLQASEEGRCAALCASDDDCGPDEWCARTRDSGVCKPIGDTGRLSSCADDAFACDEGLLCIYGGASAAFCAEECTGFAETCARGEECRFLGYARSFCLGVGDATVGESCVEDTYACNEDTWCVNPGTELAYCAQTCSFDAESCPDETECYFTDGGLGVCLPPGQDFEDPINPGGSTGPF